jgi:hypothetical protein
VCIVPGAAVHTFAGGSLATARENITQTFVYLEIAAVLFVPTWLRKWNQR